MAGKVKSMQVSLASVRLIKVGIESYQTKVEKYGQVSTFVCQGKLRMEKRTRNQVCWSSCACMHVIWIQSKSWYGLSAISDEKYANHANHAVMGDTGNAEAGSESTTTKFRVVLMGLLGLDLPVAVVQWPDTTVPHSSDILHLEIVSPQINFVL